jgi:hypothetical protein
MPHVHAEPGCREIAFEAPQRLDEPQEVALEDYARALMRAEAAEAWRAADDPAAVRGVRVCGVGLAVTRALVRDLEDFARSLVTREGGGLGWS